TKRPKEKRVKASATKKDKVIEIAKEQTVNQMKELDMPPKSRTSTEIVFFDLETQKLSNDVGGWSNVAKMGLSIAVTYSDINGFLCFTEEKVNELVSLLKSANLVVGFNHIKFDYEVLTAYTKENLRTGRNLDILLEIQKTIGHRLSLNHLAQFTLGRKKSGSGTDAPVWFQQGRFDLLEKYCRDDVAITRDLYQFGIENGYLLYQRKDGRTLRIPVSWNKELLTPDE
ncbi:MAG: ribonuclease H-like domain-containing protein, partial [Desulfomonilaceae bacterium]